MQKASKLLRKAAAHKFTFKLNMRDETLDRTLWKTRFGRGYGPVLRQATESTAYFPAPESATKQNVPSLHLLTAITFQCLRKIRNNILSVWLGLQSSSTEILYLTPFPPHSAQAFILGFQSPALSSLRSPTLSFNQPCTIAPRVTAIKTNERLCKTENTELWLSE
jgi:hypothetical protein